jgi:hypothetical protein
VVCFKCERIGQISKFCTETVNKKVTPNNVQCFSCKGFGHVLKVCPNVNQDKPAGEKVNAKGC